MDANKNFCAGLIALVILSTLAACGQSPADIQNSTPSTTSGPLTTSLTDTAVPNLTPVTGITFTPSYTLPPSTFLPPQVDPATGWLLFHSEAHRFSLQCPPGSDVYERQEDFARINLPMLNNPGTNLRGKSLWINTGSEGSEICSSPPTPVTGQRVNVTINGQSFTKSTGEDTAAGQIFQYSSYQTTHQGRCVTLTFILYSETPEILSTPIPTFNPAPETQAFEEILTTFHWLDQ